MFRVVSWIVLFFRWTGDDPRNTRNITKYHLRRIVEYLNASERHQHAEISNCETTSSFLEETMQTANGLCSMTYPVFDFF